jgi:multiple sugar transport system permease protein
MRSIIWVLAPLVVVLVFFSTRNVLARALHETLAWLDGLLEGPSERNRRRVAGLLLAPGLILIFVFGLLPLAYALYLSVWDTTRGGYTGAENYVRALRDPEFWSSLKVTIYYAVGTVPATLLASVFVAVLLFRIGRGRGLFRTVYFLPYVTSAVAAATVWRVLLRPRAGFVNVLMESVGASPQAWLLEPRGALHLATGGLVPPDVGPSLGLTCIMAFDVWHASGFAIVIVLAGLSAIPKQFEEAARIDGAGRWQVFRRITLPILSPTLFFLIIVSGIRAFQAFNSFYALTGGSHGQDTQNLVLYIYAQLYEGQRYGYGATLALLLFAGIVVLTVAQWRYLGRQVYYE